jgi:hypothetical protein
MDQTLQIPVNDQIAIDRYTNWLYWSERPYFKTAQTMDENHTIILWPLLIEKAYAKLVSKYDSAQAQRSRNQAVFKGKKVISQNAYEIIAHGGHVEISFKRLTSKMATVIRLDEGWNIAFKLMKLFEEKTDAMELHLAGHSFRRAAASGTKSEPLGYDFRKYSSCLAKMHTVPIVRFDLDIMSVVIYCDQMKSNLEVPFNVFISISEFIAFDSRLVSEVKQLNSIEVPSEIISNPHHQPMWLTDGKWLETTGELGTFNANDVRIEQTSQLLTQVVLYVIAKNDFEILKQAIAPAGNVFTVKLRGATVLVDSKMPTASKLQIFSMPKVIYRPGDALWPSLLTKAVWKTIENENLDSPKYMDVLKKTPLEAIMYTLKLFYPPERIISLNKQDLAEYNVQEGLKEGQVGLLYFYKIPLRQIFQLIILKRCILPANRLVFPITVQDGRTKLICVGKPKVEYYEVPAKTIAKVFDGLIYVNY